MGQPLVTKQIHHGLARDLFGGFENAAVEYFIIIPILR